MTEPRSFFDSESLEPSLYSPAPLMASGGDIGALCDQYLGSTSESLYDTHAARLSIDSWQEDFLRLEDHQSGALLHHTIGEVHSESADATGGVDLSGPCDLRFPLPGQSRSSEFGAVPGISYLSEYIPEDPCWSEVCEEPRNPQELPTSATFDETLMDVRGASGPELDVGSLVEALADLFCRMPANRNRDRRPKSWEFVLRLLADRRTNPTLIRWENQELGTFRLVRPHIIAKIFGTVISGKPNLSYVNFARDLRYFYKSGVLQAVPTRQLVYRCGPEALAYLRTLQQEQL